MVNQNRIARSAIIKWRANANQAPYKTTKRNRLTVPQRWGTMTEPKKESVMDQEQNQNPNRTNYDTFVETLEKHYVELFKTNKEYLTAKVMSTPLGLARKMTKHLCDGSANKDGEGIKRTCKELGIKYTYTAIKDYLK